MHKIWVKQIGKALSIIPLCLALHQAEASEILIDNYKGGLSQKWKSKIFLGETDYRAVREDDQWCLRATSRSSASALYFEIKYDPKDFPLLSWRWKVSNTLLKGNALKKKGDDYAARLYVVFHSFWFWKTRALNYVWANKLPIEEAVPNPFNQNNIMIAVESGSKHTGQWREVRRNILEDYRKYFRGEIPDVSAIALMTDTDNTGEEARAWYGPIRILSLP